MRSYIPGLEKALVTVPLMTEVTNRVGLGLLTVRISFSEASAWGAGHVRAGRPKPAFRVINDARRTPPPTHGPRGFCHLSSPLVDPHAMPERLYAPHSEGGCCVVPSPEPRELPSASGRDTAEIN